jgi:hypothetical protein
MQKLATRAELPATPADAPDGPTPRELAMERLRRSVLEALRGPEYRTVHEIPRRWPVLRAHVMATVDMLLEEGLLERIADPRSAGMVPAYRATAAGRGDGDVVHAAIP